MGRYLDFYKEHIKTGRIKDGLCNYFDNNAHEDVFELMQPTGEDINELLDEGLCATYWASGLHEYTPCEDIHWPFTPLMQTIVLFMAALAGEFDEEED